VELIGNIVALRRDLLGVSADLLAVARDLLDVSTDLLASVSSLFCVKRTRSSC
jgi:hypothetical protein